ncbi:hypothetical protein Tco_0536790 [Tanacetum coccineum]
MPSPVIPVPVDSIEESIRSSASLIILSDSDSEAPPSPAHHVVADPERSRYVSSSSSPRKRRRASPYSYSLSSFKTLYSSSDTFAASDTPTLVRPSHKRSDHLPLHKRFRDYSAPSHQEVSIEYSTEGGIKVTIEDATKPDISPLLPEQTIIERLDEHEEELEEEQRAMKDREETAETERINLRKRVRLLEIGGLSLRDTLRAKREAYARIEWTEGVVGLARWFEKMKFLFRISNCATGSQVKFATCTLDDGALTWTTPVYTYSAATDPNVGGVIGGTPYRSVFCGIDRSVMGMSWKDLMKLMIEVYWPRNEVQKLESEL